METNYKKKMAEEFEALHNKVKILLNTTEFLSSKNGFDGNGLTKEDYEIFKEGITVLMDNIEDIKSLHRIRK